MKLFECLAAVALALTLSVSARAESDAKSFKFAFSNSEITSIIEAYAKESKRKFVVDPGVRGKATIHAPELVSQEEALNLLSQALEANGFAISDRDDVSYVCSARNIQRSLIPTVREVPPMKPVRMMTMVYQLKHADSQEINKRLRVLPSKDGEMTSYEPTNQLIVTDWTPNLIRIHGLIQEIDKPETAAFKAHKEEWKNKNAKAKSE